MTELQDGLKTGASDHDAIWEAAGFRKDPGLTKIRTDLASKTIQDKRKSFNELDTRIRADIKKVGDVEFFTWAVLALDLMSLDYAFRDAFTGDGAGRLMRGLQRFGGDDRLEFTRVKFIATVLYDIAGPRFIPLANRLANEFPEDLLLLACAVITHQVQIDAKFENGAKALIDRMKSVSGSDPYTVKAEGIYYYYRWMRTNSRADSAVAIERFRKYMTLVPKSFSGYGDTNALILEMGG